MLIAICCVAISSFGQQKTYDTAKPWTFWWWMGNAVTKESITNQLELFAKAGIGGVHIIPIYGVKGYEKQFTPFLNDQWLRFLEHTTQEGKRLHIGVDLTTGTGWPFGGPNVTQETAAKKWKLEGNKLVTTLTKQQVKRPSPGGAGLVLDPFGADAMPQYLQRFDTAFAKTTAHPRAMYNDSYEVYGANWTNKFPEEFKKRRGYDIQDHISEFLDTTKNERNTLIKMDYHQTIADLVLENYATKWTNWSAKKNYISRYQAHGSPGNLLDLYATADVPETESFGSSRFNIPNLRIDDEYEIERFGIPSPLAMKFASSASNLTGKTLVSSETCTWLANHFKVSLSQVKPQVDELFTAGINHIFFHGIAYSPKEETFPGWLFYASTNFGPSSHFWNEMPQLTGYIQRCQSRLQNSQPDNDVLVYFPINDLWATSKKSVDAIYQLDIHSIGSWISQKAYGQTCKQLLEKGYSFDYISDLQLQRLKVTNGQIKAGNSNYKTIVIPSCNYLPEQTLETLLALSKQGAKIIFAGEKPSSFTGFNEFEARKAKFQTQMALLSQQSISGKDIFTVLPSLGVPQESWTDKGLRFIRKKQAGKVIYFISNLDNQFATGWITLSANMVNPRFYDVLNNTYKTIPTKHENGKTLVYLSLASGESCFLEEGQTATTAIVNNSAKTSLTLSGAWKVDFLAGKPRIQLSKTIDQLSSWTTWADSTDFFWGTVRYSKEIDLSKELASQNLSIDLGNVNESAVVKINGKVIGTAWCLPFKLTIPKSVLKVGKNSLEIEVKNLSANYMRLYDKQHPEWKKFYDANIVSVKYKPLDATKWSPMPSGLMGPVVLKTLGN